MVRRLTFLRLKDLYYNLILAFIKFLSDARIFSVKSSNLSKVSLSMYPILKAIYNCVITSAEDPFAILKK